MRPLALDLFCKAGGAARGCADAGYEVVGVDIEAQPNYPYEFIQADAMTFPLAGYDLIHASPPCQDHSELASLTVSHGTGWMLAAMVERLQAQNTPWVVENVGGARKALGGQWTVLCGSMFGLGVRRHRLFRSSELIMAPSCNHRDQPVPDRRDWSGWARWPASQTDRSCPRACGDRHRLDDPR